MDRSPPEHPGNRPPAKSLFHAGSTNRSGPFGPFCPCPPDLHLSGRADDGIRTHDRHLGKKVGQRAGPGACPALNCTFRYDSVRSALSVTSRSSHIFPSGCCRRAKPRRIFAASRRVLSAARPATSYGRSQLGAPGRDGAFAWRTGFWSSTPGFWAASAPNPTAWSP